MAKNQDCIFCKIVKKEIPTDFVAESNNFVAFLDINPKVEGHTLIIPKKHFTNFMDIPSDLAMEMSDMIKKIAERRLRDGVEGFNVLSNNFPVAGQVVMHAHTHFLPRKRGDGLKMAI